MQPSLPPAADALSGVFGVLRERLRHQIDARDAATADEARLNRVHAGTIRGATALLARIAHEHAARVPVHSLVTPARATQQEHLRRLRLRREQLQQRVQIVQTALDATLRGQLQRLEEQNDAFQRHVDAAQTSSVQRLQALCVECVTETHKAVQRARHAFDSKATSNDVSLRAQTTRLNASLQWQIFLARVAEDTQHELQATALSPTMNGPHTTVDANQLEAELARAIASNGPVIAENERVIVDTIVAVANSKENTLKFDEPRGSRKASLHFVDTMSAAWTEITTTSRADTSHSKLRRSAPPASIHALVPFTSSGTRGFSALRRVVGTHDSRFTAMPLDTPLRCSGIGWLLRSYLQQAAKIAATPSRLRDWNVYVALKECGADIVQITRTESNSSAFEAIRRRNEELRELAGVTVSPNDQCHASAANIFIVDIDNEVFVRATLLELLRMTYARDHFFPLLEKDVDHAETYPSWLREVQSMTGIYVAVETASDSGVRMVELDVTCLHELCVLYIARGICAKSTGRRPITSLAKADAFDVLPPNTTENSKFCIMRNASSLIRSAGSVRSHALIGRRATLFVEYHIESFAPKSIHNANSVESVTVNKKKEVLRLLGPVCSWRSCLDTMVQLTSPSGLILCDWHNSLQGSVSEAAHFLPSMKELKACVKSREELCEVDTARNAFVKASSLLRELASRQLGHSIAAFLEHAKLGVSNTEFEGSLDNQGVQARMESDESISDDDVSISNRRGRLDMMKQILAVEHVITSTIREAIERGLSMPREFETEWNQLSNDIRTDNHELILELSRRKLTLLQNCRWEGNCIEVSQLRHSQSDGTLAERGVGRDPESLPLRRLVKADRQVHATQRVRPTRPKSATNRMN